MAHPVASLINLNQKRWEENLRAADAATRPDSEPKLHSHPLAPTSGHVFYRSNPRCPEDGTYTRPWGRYRNDGVGGFAPRPRGDPEFYKLSNLKPEPYNTNSERNTLEEHAMLVRGDNGQKYFKTYGVNDCFSIKPWSVYKYRIPNTSVVNKKGDCKLFCCCGYRLTAAQWIWFLNAICCLAHTIMVFLTLHFAYWNRGFELHETDHVSIKIYRISSIPTREMLDSNSTVWNDDGPRWSDKFYLYDNGMPINLATLIVSFFALSAIFHFIACVLGGFESCWFWYWRQMDDSFCYWRWIEYSASASIMAVGIALSVGLREQSILAGIFMLHFATMWFGFLVEYVSTPKYKDDENTYFDPVGPVEWDKYRLRTMEDSESRQALRKKLIRTYDQETILKWESDALLDPDKGYPFKPDYNTDRNALKIISQTEWDGDRPADHIKADGFVKLNAQFVQAQRCSNFIRRMVPHALGWFPMTAAWVIILVHLEWARMDLEKITDRTIPSWVDGMIYGTVLIFWSFAFVQIIYQTLPPGFFWGSEIIYCALSLTSKLFLGWFLLINVIMVDGTAEEALSGTNS